ncbi:hypothetical protein [Mucilaginibacter polytrichastri]|uniref:Uncharacterized protein n=1 Tax=Mucilaginibacter polytrichastri TaxID=1302689 RepID=A0A1Q6A4P5_9SPHI|nr:hypothetical protein [Mucilaginibacter polytrichastri]OKS88975.1 hypothetical protein RG47T_4453 [Mucilaginibacter polytrichastri]SFS95005.1 hypothetical protein SAMN04487890_10715 [Mucilaginibacter polytrichastri]
MEYSAWGILIIDSLLGLSLLFLKQLGKSMYPVALAVIISLIEEIVAHLFTLKFNYNLNVYFFFNPIEYACFAWFFYVNIDYKTCKKLIKASVLLFFSFIIGYLYYFTKLTPLPAKILLDYVIATKGLLLTLWSIAYIINIFDQISNYKKLSVYVLMVVAALLFYSCFSIILNFSEIYLVNYSELHNVPLTVMFSPLNKAHMYASQQYAAVKPLLYLTNILLYLCIFVALIKSATKPKKAYSI